MVKETLHSFRQTTFKQKAFLIKADISKAFDKVKWDFLEQAMRYLNVPEKIIRMMMSSYCRAKITVKINGNGDGFIRPMRGLRQGCPMSPYAFIIAMEVLSRLLQKEQIEGRIKGIKLAHTSPEVTHMIYADDLVVMGNTNQGQMQRLIQIFDMFGAASGLMMNPEKSKVWFSRACDEESTQRTLNLMRANGAGTEEKYLGALMVQSRSAKETGKMLLEKLRAKLTGWKSHMLSHAGRLVLINSALMSVPVYYMSIEQMPKRVIKEINSLLAKFFWGKTRQNRYMALVAWKKICRPIQDGGLGVRNLEWFGQALLQKLAWSVIANEQKLWVRMCKAKYCPQIGIWRVKQQSNSSPMWKSIIKLKENFRDCVKWQIGDGTQVRVRSEPWFGDWHMDREISRSAMGMTVAEAFNETTGQWREDCLSTIFDEQTVQQIMATADKPRERGTKDRLIWEHSKKGKYTVKEGYLRLQNLGSNGQIDANAALWSTIWTWKEVVPKVRIFLWRLISGGLMLAQNMHRRIHNFSPMCQRCHTENEYESHCFFFCPGSRVVWFESSLGLRTHDVPINIQQAINQCTTGLNSEQIRIFCYTMWEIWKARNATVIRRESFNPREIGEKARAWMHNDNLQSTSHNDIAREHFAHHKYQYKQQGWQILVDGSWDTSNRAGSAHVIYSDGKLWRIGVSTHTLLDAFQTEALALREALQHLQEIWGDNAPAQVMVYSDCQNLVDAINEGELEDIPAWRAAQEITQSLQIMAALPQGVIIKHARREAINQAHLLATQARRKTQCYRGVPRFWRTTETDLSQNLDTAYFQRVQEDPP